MQKKFDKPSEKQPVIEQRQFERAQIAQRDAFWVCDSCKQEFRISREAPPVCCPKCGRPRASSLGETANSELWSENYVCPKSQETVQMLDGQRARICPCCGWAMRSES